MTRVAVAAKRSIERVAASTGLIKGQASLSPGDGFVPGYSASGQDVWVPAHLTSATKPGLVLSSVGARCGKVFLAEHPHWGTVANTSAWFARSGWDIRFLHYFFNREDFWIKGGSAQPYVQEQASLSQQLILFTPSEQCSLVEYLDYETAQIDALIGKQERLIETLRERRAAAVERLLVTGVEASATLTRCSISWLRGAEVPAHWTISRVRYLIRSMRSGETITAESIEAAGDYPVYGGNGHRGYTTASTHSGQHILVGRQGALCGNVHLVEGEFWASEHAIVITPKDGVETRWLAAMLRLMNLGQYSQTAAQPGIGTGQITPLPLLVPPLDEQRRIAVHLDEQTAKIDVLIAKAERFIEVSKERRSALITAAVTGQIDVRETA